MLILQCTRHCQVPIEPQLSSGYSFWLPVPKLAWRSIEVAADLPE